MMTEINIIVLYCIVVSKPKMAFDLLGFQTWTWKQPFLVYFKGQLISKCFFEVFVRTKMDCGQKNVFSVQNKISRWNAPGISGRCSCLSYKSFMIIQGWNQSVDNIFFHWHQILQVNTTSDIKMHLVHKGKIQLLEVWKKTFKYIFAKQTLFLKLVHPEYQVNHRNHSFAVEWDKLSPWNPSVKGHHPQPPPGATGAILILNAVHKTKSCVPHWMFYFFSEISSRIPFTTTWYQWPLVRTWLSSINWQIKLQKCSKLKFLKFEICKTFLKNKLNTFLFLNLFSNLTPLFMELN